MQGDELPPHNKYLTGERERERERGGGDKDRDRESEAEIDRQRHKKTERERTSAQLTAVHRQDKGCTSQTQRQECYPRSHSESIQAGQSRKCQNFASFISLS